MIVREWRGCADYDRQNDYPSYFRAQVVPELRQIPGFIGADLLRRDVGGAIEFTVLTKWESMDAVHAFAGRDSSAARVEAEAIEALIDYDEFVSHHEVIDIFAAE